MSDPFPVGGYGVANWQDYTHNWRKLDTDWLQTRTILRYQAGPPASGEVGQMVYDFAADKVVLRSKANKWIPVVAAENLKVEPVTSTSPSEGVGLTHKAASGQGLVFIPSEIIVYQPFRTGASEVVIDSTGLTLKTGATTAKLTTDATSLVSSTPFTAPGLVSTSTLTVTGLSALLDINARDATFSRNVSITGTLGVTGLITASSVQIDAAPSAANRAANKAYVDAQVALQLTPTEGDARYVNIGGDTMTGRLDINPAGSEALRVLGATSNVEFYNEAGTVRHGYLQGQTTAMILSADAADIITFRTGNVERMRLHNGQLLVGLTAPGSDAAGISLSADASTEGRVTSIVSVDTSYSNFVAKHIGTMDDPNQAFFLCQNTAGTTVGLISQGSGANTIFQAGAGGAHVATSDYRLKDVLGPIEDPIGRLNQLKPYHLQWKPEAITVGEFDGFLAHEVSPIEASAVVGEKDAVYPAGHPHAGEIDPQGLDEKRLVPLLVAAVQELTTRLEALEA